MTSKQQHAADTGSKSGMPIRFAVLFWFYKRLDVCESRLALLRSLNPGIAIYGLYGGPVDAAMEVQLRLGSQLDDLYVYTECRDNAWKWQHGDRLIAAWHRDRGRRLLWDTVVVVQWDMLILKPIEQLFHMLRLGEALFSGVRPAYEVASWWGWLNPDDPEKRSNLEMFQDHVRAVHGYGGELWCCLFIVVCLPRQFLDRYLAAGPPKAGFLEYKVPTMAKAFGTPLCTEHPFKPWWARDPETRHAPIQGRILNAVGATVTLDTVLAESTAERAYVFHPYTQPFP
jgi:hypothetical protein